MWIDRVPFALIALAGTAQADPLRLRADALATTASPVGLLSLDADAKDGPMTAEAAVWVMDDKAEVLVITVGATDRTGRARGKVGRFVQMLGALRPTHVDGAAGRLRLPKQIDVEAFAGLPVEPQLGVHAWDWVVGGRASRRIGDYGSIGVAMLEQREEGRLAIEEAGVDAGFAIGTKTDLGARLAYDLANPGVAEATATTSRRHGAVRTEVYAGYRAASHLVPATSLFSVLGDVPSVRAGSVVSWKAAPRLDVIGEAGVRRAEDSTAPLGVVRAKLRLDDKGTSALSAELRRDGVGDDAWFGVRGSARIALRPGYMLATELELVMPDHAKGRGAVWPWGLVAVSRDAGMWHAAIAVEASASPVDVYRVDAMFQLGRRWGGP